MSKLKLISFLFIFFIIFNTSFAAYVGLESNALIDSTTGDIALPAQVIFETGTEYARVNFILGPWSAPDDSTPHGANNKTWFQTFDTIIDSLISRGVKVYGLIGAESVHSSYGLNTDQYVADYAANFVKIVEHFKDRVRVYESFNEPNDWAGGSSAQVQPLYFAKMLEKIYRDVKINNGHSSDSSWQVTLISGPLFSHDLDTVAAYFAQVYSEGINNLTWTNLKNTYGTYPLDGIGYHNYVAQGATDLATIQSKMLGNMNAVWGSVTTYEGAATTKKLWISEFGWNSAYTEIGEAGQAANLEKGFNILLNDSRVQLATWFCLKGWGSDSWGIFRNSGVSESDKKPAWTSFHNIALANKTPLSATIVSQNVPDEMIAGETCSITVTMKNAGSQSWSGTGASNAKRLAAVTPTENSSYPNGISWANFSSGGYFNSVSDAQAYLSGTVASGSETSFTFSITAPNNSGAVIFSAKMFDTATGQYFGDSISKYIMVRKDNDNLLLNAGFESGNINSWIQFGQTDGAISGSWFAGITAEEGNYFLGMASNYGTKNGGIYQQCDANAGTVYAMRAYIRTYKEGTGESRCRIGLDPSGGTDQNSASVIWSDWKSSQGTWTPVYVFTKPAGSKITAFLQNSQTATVWNITAFDNCVLVPGKSASNVSCWFLLR